MTVKNPRSTSGKIGTKKGLALAQLGMMLEYPDQTYLERMKKLAESVRKDFPETDEPLQNLLSHLSEKPFQFWQEFYTSTFDLAAICSLYVTGYIFGDENFDRGTIMAIFNEQFETAGFNPGKELPDHLCCILKFAAHLDCETLQEMTDYCLLKPVESMIEQLKLSDNKYQQLLSAILIVLKNKDYEE
ncbi:MAG: nitrate reductase molybdenum cofactor assembly chaperone [Cyanobacteria bacterium TGS_CYA1]|nr:nitrate reductase molybdenum cofactor assembly chaperone [Cyanobacteria bacterium TGS_CYA1]